VEYPVVPSTVGSGSVVGCILALKDGVLALNLP